MYDIKEHFPSDYFQGLLKCFKEEDTKENKKINYFLIGTKNDLGCGVSDQLAVQNFCQSNGVLFLGEINSRTKKKTNLKFFLKRFLIQ